MKGALLFGCIGLLYALLGFEKTVVMLLAFVVCLKVND